MGYLAYTLVDVIGVAISSIFYHYRAGSFTKAGGVLAGIQLMLMNIGTTAAATMMMLHEGYQDVPLDPGARPACNTCNTAASSFS